MAADVSVPKHTEKMEDNATAALNDVVTQYNTYEDFLDSQITPLALYYLEDEELARQLVEMGHRGTGKALTREEFRKAATEASPSNRKQQITLASAGKDLGDNFLRALAEREEANRTGKMTSIIFIRDHNAVGQEISGYIDYAHRLQTQEFEPYFSGKKRLMPRALDLSFYNWKTQMSTSNSSPNYEVLTDNSNGLMFKNRRDGRILDPGAEPRDNSSRTALQSNLYSQVIFYDHMTQNTACQRTVEHCN